MRNCMSCGELFDNEIWLLGTSPEGEPELHVFEHRRCEECWKNPTRKPRCCTGGWDGILRCG